MRLIVTGGGTGGHLFPAIALAVGIRERRPETRVLFIGTPRLLDQQALTGLGFEQAVLACGGVKGLRFSARVRSVLQLPGAVVHALRLIAEFRPNLVFGVGGYVTGPVILAAWMRGVPVGIHEQNSVPGMANRLAGRLARQVFISLPCSPPFPEGKTLLTGNPVRREILAVAREERRLLSGEKMTVLVLGGSQGAHRVNTLMLEAMDRMKATADRLHVIHQTGVADRDMVAARYQQLGVSAEVQSFFSDMAAVYARADLAVSRAGATTLAELAVLGLPALLIPYPFAADNHQASNGRYYAEGGGCEVFEESWLTGDILAGRMIELLHNRDKFHTMAANMRAKGKSDATDSLVEACLALADAG